MIALMLLVLVNVFTFMLYVIDKRRAVKGKWRISEGCLIFFTLMFGGIGALLGMCIARHKTRKIKFKLAVAAGLIVALVPILHIAYTLAHLPALA